MLEFSSTGVVSSRRTALRLRDGPPVSNISNEIDSSSVDAGGTIFNGDRITSCLDTKRQKTVALGDYYYTDSCTLCLCSDAESMCKQISCAPPQKCDGYIKKDPMHCCDICVPAVVIERSNDQSSLNMKMGALMVTLFLIISLILFTLHRMRRKRLLVTLRSLHAFRHQNSICSHRGDSCRRSQIVCGNGLFAVRAHNGTERCQENGGRATAAPTMFYQTDTGTTIIPEAPPPYSAAVELPRPPEPLALALAPSQPIDPPPPYQTNALGSGATLRPGTLSSSGSNSGRSPGRNGGGGWNACWPSNTSLAVADQRQSRTSDYADEEDVEGGSDSETSCSSSLSSSTSTSSSTSSLSASRNSISSSDDYCRCSQCDSGMSEERGSFSSNEVRPRLEALAASAGALQNFFTVGRQRRAPDASSSSAVAAATATATATAVSASASSGTEPTAGGGVASTAPTGVGTSGENRTQSTKSKLCKKKLKKLLAKARKRSKRRTARAKQDATRQDTTAASTGVNEGAGSTNVTMDHPPITSV